VLGELTPTLLHGDVHPGNVLVDGDQATLIDWGSCRVGPAAFDLANLMTADSADVARYARAWRELTGQPLPGGTIELGYRWAALQIPVQYLPWMTEHRPTRDVEAALDRIERALDDLPARLGQLPGSRISAAVSASARGWYAAAGGLAGVPRRSHPSRAA
jgi:aminoglycoside phosphotransferase (APT) family kinase protein